MSIDKYIQTIRLSPDEVKEGIIPKKEHNRSRVLAVCASAVKRFMRKQVGILRMVANGSRSIVALSRHIHGHTTGLGMGAVAQGGFRGMVAGEESNERGSDKKRNQVKKAELSEKSQL